MVEEIKAMLEPKEEKEEEEIMMSKDSVLEEKEKEIETLKTELAKTPEVESVKVTPEVKAKNADVKMKSYNKNSIKTNVFQALANNVW